MTSTHSSHPAPLPYTRLPDLTGSTVENGKLKLVELLGPRLICQGLQGSGQPIDCIIRGTHPLRRLWPAGVVALHRAFVEGEHVFVVMELCDTDLNRFVIEHKDCDEQCDVAKRVFLDVLDAVETCHAEGVFHRDLKPGNILCDADGKNIRIADLVLRLGLKSRNSSAKHGQDSRHILPSRDGCWSLGVILIALMTSSLLWKAPVESDDTYCAYRADPAHFLRGTLDLSPHSARSRTGSSIPIRRAGRAFQSCARRSRRWTQPTAQAAEEQVPGDAASGG
ncbi:unnamed protein product [Mycena citricolor]|uniref:non-specific serine/threonine protein kinase n=1 Tax=Mycena citricolor TaxID=2018698 RepID=A0AAD2K7R3_9AGAR|nr:unnamed protein product [Mycena citricolor]